MKITLSRREKGVGILALALAAALAVPAPVYAVFGVEDTVEPGPLWNVWLTNQQTAFNGIWAQNISTFAKTVESVVQLEKIYAQGLQAYNLATALSHSFSGPNKAQWITVAQMAVQDVTRDQYGENTAWSSTLNGNPNQAAMAWKMSTVALNQGINLAQETPGQSAALARLASIEAMDGASTGCLQTLGAYHGNALANALGPVLKLAIARMDGSAETNSEIEQLNLVNAHQGQLVNEMMAQGQINSCMAQQMMLANKIQRDNQVEALNTYTQMQSNVAANPMQLSTVSSLFDQ